MTENVKGTSVHYETLGEQGSKVLLLHGWGCSLSMMQQLGAILSGEHRVMMIDFPGHGESGRPPVPWGVPEYAECLEELLRRTDFVPCAVIAHSFGCRVAAWLAAEKPGLFTRMIFTGAAGIRPKQTEAAKKKSERYRRLKEICEGIRKIPGLVSAADGLEKKLREKYGSPDYNALDEDMRRTFVKVINLDLSDCYPKIRQSTLLIWGDEDTETPLWMGREMEKRIPDAGLVILEGGTHFAFLEQLPRFSAIALHFLKEGQ